MCLTISSNKKQCAADEEELGDTGSPCLRQILSEAKETAMSDMYLGFDNVSDVEEG